MIKIDGIDEYYVLKESYSGNYILGEEDINNPNIINKTYNGVYNVTNALEFDSHEEAERCIYNIMSKNYSFRLHLTIEKIYINRSIL